MLGTEPRSSARALNSWVILQPLEVDLKREEGSQRWPTGTAFSQHHHHTYLQSSNSIIWTTNWPSSTKKFPLTRHFWSEWMQKSLAGYSSLAHGIPTEGKQQLSCLLPVHHSSPVCYRHPNKKGLFNTTRNWPPCRWAKTWHPSKLENHQSDSYF